MIPKEIQILHDSWGESGEDGTRPGDAGIVAGALKSEETTLEEPLESGRFSEGKLSGIFWKWMASEGERGRTDDPLYSEIEDTRADIDSRRDQGEKPEPEHGETKGSGRRPLRFGQRVKEGVGLDGLRQEGNGGQGRRGIGRHPGRVGAGRSAVPRNPRDLPGPPTKKSEEVENEHGDLPGVQTAGRAQRPALPRMP